MLRLATTAFATCLTFALLAPAALAADQGEGWWGETNDKIVTNAGFILIIFFPLFIAFMSAIQWRQEKRKDAKKAAAKKLRASEGATWRGGW